MTTSNSSPASKENELSPELKVLIRDEIDTRVEKRLASAQKWVNTLLGWATKILAAAVTFFICAMAFFGFQTIKDFKTWFNNEMSRQANELSATTSKRVDEEIKKIKPDGRYQENLDEFYNKALIASYLLQMNMAEKDLRFGRNPVLPDADRKRILRALQNPELEPDRFEDLLRVAATESKLGTEFGQFAKQLLTQTLDIKTSVTAGEVKARSIIVTLQKYGIGDLTGPAFELVKDKGHSAALRLAALRYLGEFGSTQLATELEALAPAFEFDEPQKYMLWAVIARWIPDSKIIQPWLSDLEQRAGNASPFELLPAWEILSGITKQRSGAYFQESPTPAQKELNDKRVKLASQIIRILVSSKARVIYSKDRIAQGFGAGLWLRLGSTSYGIDREVLLNWSSFQVFGNIIISLLKDKKTNELNQLLEVVCIRSDNFAQESDRFATGISLVLGENTKIVTPQAKLEKKDIVGNAMLLPGQAGRPIVVWRDRLGVVKSEPFQDIEGVDDTFKVLQQAIIPLNFDNFEY